MEIQATKVGYTIPKPSREDCEFAMLFALHLGGEFVTVYNLNMRNLGYEDMVITVEP